MEVGIDTDGVGEGERGKGRHMWKDEGGEFREEDRVGFEELECGWLG